MSRKKKKDAYRKDILRTIGRARKRFFSIMVVTILGTTMFSGLQAACEDLKKTADDFFDEQELHDLNVQSSLGMTDADVDALLDLEGVRAAAGYYSENLSVELPGEEREIAADTGSGSDSETVSVTPSVGVTLTTLTEGIDEPYLVSGRMPETAAEAVVTQKFIDESGLEIGDTFVIPETEDADTDSASEDSTDSASEADTEADTSSDSDSDTETTLDFDFDSLEDEDFEVSSGGSGGFIPGTYTITGIVVDVRHMDNPTGALSYRTSSEEAEQAFVLPEAVDADYYTGVAVLLENTREYSTFSEDYENTVRQIRSVIAGDFADSRAQARLDEVQQEAQDTLDDSAQEALDKLEEAGSKIDEAEAELTDAKAEISDGWQQLEDGQTEIDDSREEIAQKRQELTDAQTQLEESAADAEQQFADAQAEIDAGQSQIDEAQAEIDAGQEQLAEAQAQLDAQQEALNAQAADPQADQSAIAAAQAEIDAAQQQLTAQAQQLEESQQELDAQKEQLETSQQELDAQKEQLETNRQQITDGLAELDEAEQTLDENQETLDEQKQELLDGQQEIEENAAALEEAKTELTHAEALVYQKLADAQQEIDDISLPDWYVQDRGYLSGYSNIQSDADSIQAIGTVFPIVFFIVAVLISLTTITRMVDEQRGLIGTYKSLGFTDTEIRRKYMVYAALACISGAIVGTFMAFVTLPQILLNQVFTVMYLFPSYTMTFIPSWGLGGPLIFLAGVLLAAWLACRSELVQKPAALMRPKSPKAGSRILLERIPALWNRLSFLNKVTARNLFRYKKRMLMTILGIGGCMALLLFGYAIHDSVYAMPEKQYREISLYDLMAAGSADDNDLVLAAMDTDSISDYVNIEISQVRIGYNGDEISAQIIVFPEDADISGWVSLTGLKGETYGLADGDVYITENAGSVLDFTDGETVTVQLADLAESDISVTGLVKNCLGNYIYLTENTFEELFGEDFEPNGVLAHFTEETDAETQIAEGKRIRELPGVTSCVTNAEMEDTFSQSFKLMDMIVWIVIVLSAALAFTVLFTLAAINISEREREMATIKVLGFYNPEVHLYLNKETWILTSIGIVLGIPLGYLFAQSISIILKLPAITLPVTLNGISCVYSAGLCVLFNIIVTLITDRSLDKIDPVTALKSVE